MLAIEDTAKLSHQLRIDTNIVEWSGFGFGFDFEAALPYFAMAAKAQEGGGPKATTDALLAFGKMKGEQASS